MPTSADPLPTPPSGWRAFLADLNGTRVATALALGVLAALALNPIFLTPFPVLLGRMVFLSMMLLVAFLAARSWSLPLVGEHVPRWVLQAFAVALAAPVATLLMYLLFVGGNLGAFLRSEALISGFLWIAGTGTIGGLLLALGALVREREAQLRSQQLHFALERSTLEKQALDARLKLLHSQIEPHFLFNTLANIQALVESGSPKAAPVLGSLIRYLRASMPHLGDRDPTLGQEAARVRAYLELMRMRMPDRLQYAVEIDPALEGWRFPPLGLLTLVENAVRHGIDPQESGGRIEVAARRVGRAIRLSVRDDGAGFGDGPVAGTGLANLRERLRAFYDGAAQLELAEAAPRGVRAEIAVEDAS